MTIPMSKAVSIVKQNIPNGKIDAAIRYKDLYLFRVFTDDKLEGNMDPFYSVDSKNGDFNAFSIFNDDGLEILNLFIKNTNRGG